MVLNTWFEHAPVRVFQPNIGDTSHLLCTQLVSLPISAPWWSVGKLVGSFGAGINRTTGSLRALTEKHVVDINSEF